MRQTSRQPKPRHFKLTVTYDGTQYAGWQLQPNGKTIQEVVETALAKIDGREVRVHGSGRTDAGVHARGQVANCTLRTQLKMPILLKAVNANLPEDVRVLRLQETDAKFHARFSAKGKEYRYQIDGGAVADPFLRAFAWHRPWPLNVDAMRRAAGLLKGRHDFSELSVIKRGSVITVSVTADGFLYKMVRSIVGALVKVGEGRLTVEELQKLVKAKKRTALVETAPAHGVFLWRVFY